MRNKTYRNIFSLFLYFFFRFVLQFLSCAQREVKTITKMTSLYQLSVNKRNEDQLMN